VRRRAPLASGARNAMCALDLVRVRRFFASYKVLRHTCGTTAFRNLNFKEPGRHEVADSAWPKTGRWQPSAFRRYHVCVAWRHRHFPETTRFARNDLIFSICSIFQTVQRQRHDRQGVCSFTARKRHPRRQPMPRLRAASLRRRFCLASTIGASVSPTILWHSRQRHDHQGVCSVLPSEVTPSLPIGFPRLLENIQGGRSVIATAYGTRTTHPSTIRIVGEGR
jgi:hypothetical protein